MNSFWIEKYSLSWICSGLRWKVHPTEQKRKKVDANDAIKSHGSRSNEEVASGRDEWVRTGVGRIIWQPSRLIWEPSWSFPYHHTTSAEDVCPENAWPSMQDHTVTLHNSFKSQVWKKKSKILHFYVCMHSHRYCDAKHKCTLKQTGTHARTHTHTNAHTLTRGSTLCDVSLVVVRQHDEVCGD